MNSHDAARGRAGVGRAWWRPTPRSVLFSQRPLERALYEPGSMGCVASVPVHRPAAVPFFFHFPLGHFVGTIGFRVLIDCFSTVLPQCKRYTHRACHFVSVLAASKMSTHSKVAAGSGSGLLASAFQPCGGPGSNPSLNRSTNGRPPSPGRQYGVHFCQPGLGCLPLAHG